MSSYLGPQTPPVLSYHGQCGPLPLLSLILSCLCVLGTNCLYSWCDRGFAGKTQLRRHHNNSRDSSYAVKKVNNFPVPSRNVTNQTLNSPWPGIMYLFPARESLLVTFQLETWKSPTFFTVYHCIYTLPDVYSNYIESNEMKLYL